MRYREIMQTVSELMHRSGRNPNEIKLIAVSKHQSDESVRACYDLGCRDFGENRALDALNRIPRFPDDVCWHLIGTLQTKKVPKVIGQFSLIHSVDSIELAQEIGKRSEQKSLETKILLQANTSGEGTKHGLSPDEWKRAFEELKGVKGISIEGLMTMAPYTEDKEAIRSCFRELRKLRDQLGLKELSMGMSNDYPIAIEEGATLLRIGTEIFNQ